MSPRFETAADLPGQGPVAPRRSGGALPLAALAGAAWPPLILTFLVWPPSHWLPGTETDWRLLVLVVGLIAVPAGLWRIGRERDQTGRPGTRLGVVWRFMFYGGLLAAALQTLMALIVTVVAMVQSGSLVQALGAAETTLLIYGVGGLPIAIIVGVSYALWAGLCAAFIAFVPRPPVKDRLGLMREEA